MIVTHNANLRKIADRTLIIKDGQIIRELGKKKDKEISGVEEEDAMNEVYDEAEKVFNPAFRILEFNEIKMCPACDSTNIVKKWDQENGSFIMHNN